MTLDVGERYSFQAGQYLCIHLGEEDLLPLSIASAPARLPELHLHYRSTPGDPLALRMDRLLDTTTRLAISPAQGEVIAPPEHAALFVVAGGTGIAQAFSCAAARPRGQTTILWCADRETEIYELATLEEQPGVTVVTCVDDRRTPENEGLAWLAEHAGAFRDTHTILAGSPPFVYAVTDVLEPLGVRNLHSDVYAYAPRARPD